MKPPSDATLVRYLLGTAAQDEAAQVERYLAADPEGFERLERVRADDDLVAKVRAVMSADQETLATGPEVTLAAAPQVAGGTDNPTIDSEAVTRQVVRVDDGSGPSGSAVPVAGKTPAVRIEGYKILEELGRGGMGVVYSAMQQSTKRKVALKVLLEGPFASKAARRRFEREVELAARLNHPNVVAILESGVASGRYYFAMQYIEGLTLDKHLLAHRPPVTQRLRIFARICRAVNYAHQCGIIHRDLKPSNILIDEHGEPHVLDFGLAKPADTYTDDLEQSKALSLTGQLMGTLPYMSPEQAAGRNQQIDIRTDIYSLGIMLYEALTGQFPYEVVGRLLDVLHNIQEASPQRPSTIHRRINDELETIVLKALAKEPDRRYQSAEGLAGDIEAFLSGAPIEAKRDSSLYVARKLLFRHRRLISLVLILFAVLIIGGTIVRRQRARIAESSGAQRLLADFVSDAAAAGKAYAESSPRVQQLVQVAAARFVHASAAPQRVIGAASGLHVQPDAFWQSIEDGPLFENGEWLEICQQQEALPSTVLAAIHNIATTGTPRQRYVAWCLWGALASPQKAEARRKTGLEAAAAEKHAGIQAAIRWAVRVATDNTPAPTSNAVFDDELSGLHFVLIPAGTAFQRGSPATDRDRFDDESGARPVDITAHFVAETEVTWSAWKAFLEDPASHAVVDTRQRTGMATLLASLPPESRPRAAAGFITKPAALAYCAWLTARAAKTDRPRGYRLPSEDEWEYACRGGSAGRFCYGDDADYAGYFANCNGANPTWHVVARHMPNWYGLFDMHGGLWEWTSSMQAEPTRALAVYRGGAFYSPAVRCRSAQRNYGAPNVADSYRGLRLVMEFIEQLMRKVTPVILVLAAAALSSCGSEPALLPIETGFSFTNLSRNEYAALAIRTHDPDGHTAGDYFHTALLAPGATTRIRFLDALDHVCPDALDFQIFIYERINAELPIGLDPGETVAMSPRAAGEVLGLPACAVQPLGTYTVVNWDAPLGAARVKFAQATPVENAILAGDFFPGTDALWVVEGADPELTDTAPPDHARLDAIAGRVVSAAGEPLENVGVLLRARFRLRANDDDDGNDPDAGFGDPIAVNFTDVDGRFRFERPAGGYRVEVFADDLIFRPASVDVEVPQAALVFVAEALE